METTTSERLNQKGMLSLAAVADDKALWLRFTDGNGDHVYMSPEQIRDICDNRYYQERTWALISPLEWIAEKAEILAIAHENFQRARRTVTSWYERRAEEDARADKEDNQ